MIISPSLPSGHTFFCDDLRHEVTGKVTFVGVYGSAMFVGQLPLTLPKLCCVVTYRESPEATGQVSIRVLYETEGSDDRLISDATYEVPAELELPPSEKFVMREARLYVELSPLEIKTEGVLKVRAYRDEDEIRIGALKIALHEAMEDTPSEQ